MTSERNKKTRSGTEDIQQPLSAMAALFRGSETRKIMACPGIDLRQTSIYHHLYDNIKCDSKLWTFDSMNIEKRILTR